MTGSCIVNVIEQNVACNGTDENIQSLALISYIKRSFHNYIVFVYKGVQRREESLAVATCSGLQENVTNTEIPMPLENKAGT